MIKIQPTYLTQVVFLRPVFSWLQFSYSLFCVDFPLCASQIAASPLIIPDLDRRFLVNLTLFVFCISPFAATVPYETGRKLLLRMHQSIYNIYAGFVEKVLTFCNNLVCEFFPAFPNFLVKIVRNFLENSFHVANLWRAHVCLC